MVIPHAASLRSPVVIVAEDDLVTRRRISLALVRDGFNVLDVGDGAELEQWIHRLIARGCDQRCVGLIIADQSMPTVTGVEVLTHLRRLDWATPFILIAMCSDREAHMEADRLGARVLDKPFALDTLREAVRRFAAPHEA